MSHRKRVPLRRVAALTYPQLVDYAQIHEEFRPFVGFVHRPRYRSDAVNTDALGLREHYDHDGAFIDLQRPPVGVCDVLLGGSAAFGVGASSDRATLAAHLNGPGRPCLNLGLCGATAQQELALFLVLRPRLPAVRDVILLTGVNEPVLAALDRAIIHPEYGGAFAAKPGAAGPDLAAVADPRGTAALRWLRAQADRAYSTSRMARTAARWATRNERPGLARRALSFDERLDALLAHVASGLAVWAALQRGWPHRVHYVLQPVASWTARVPTALERALLADERQAIPGAAHLDAPDVYERVREAVESACAAEGIAFHDANEWLAEPAFASAELFVDSCHLTDEGYRLLGARVRAAIEGA
jgi:hypothetical protein